MFCKKLFPEKIKIAFQRTPATNPLHAAARRTSRPWSLRRVEINLTWPLKETPAYRGLSLPIVPLRLRGLILITLHQLDTPPPHRPAYRKLSLPIVPLRPRGLILITLHRLDTPPPHRKDKNLSVSPLCQPA